MEELLEGLYGRHRNGIFSFLVGMVRDTDVAEDLTQETFARAVAAAGGFRRDALPKTWLFTIARNLAINHLRSRAHRSRAPLPDLSERPGTAAEPLEKLAADEAGKAVSAAIGELPPEQREVFLMKVIEGLTYRQIGDVVGCPIGTVQSRFYYAVRRLRDMLTREGVER